MELAMGAMASLGPKLGNLLKDEYVKQMGLKDDIVALSRELVTIHAALVDASRVPLDQLTELDKLWGRQVRELSYDMEDVIDDFILRVDSCESDIATDANVFNKIFSKIAAVMKRVKDRHQISDKVKDIKRLSNELASIHAKYTLRGAGANRAASIGIDPRVINLYKKESDLVGIEETKDKVIRMLMGNSDHAHARGFCPLPSTSCSQQMHASDQSLKIVSIVGVGGLGKTTLAKTVHDKLKKQFECYAFVSVGRTPDLDRIFENMLGKLDAKYKNRTDMARWNSEQFLEELQIFLQHKRYFIVVDDIWDKKSWKAIKHALEGNSCGSKVIMTTRNFEVVTKAEEEVHRLKPLSYDNSKKLFYKRIQSKEGEIIDDRLAEVSSKIIYKCGGVPLAIISIASLLVETPCEDWEKVYHSIGFGDDEDIDNTMKILSYSYNDLPSYLKPCLLHISIYPEDFVFDTNSMIWVWIGEGFVQYNKGDNPFEIGERYFKELVNRSMIQPMEDKFDQFAQWFRVHDIVFDLICELSRDENYATILGSREQQASSASSREKKTGMPRLDKVRRLVVLNHHAQNLPGETMDKPEVLRSLHIIESEIGTMAPLDSFRICRVLYIHGSNIPIHLKHMGRLLHLKYLEIQDTPVAELPKEIGHLKSLQALLLINIGLQELPPAVCSLTQLMCLIVEGFERFPADRMGNLTSLEELRLKSVAGRSATEDLVVELGKLTKLRMVTITFSEELEESLQKALVQSLCNMQELQELALYSKMAPSQPGDSAWEGWVPPRKLRRLLTSGIIFTRRPEWINNYCLPLLYFLSMDVYVVEVQDLDNLARLTELSYIMLDGCSWPPAYTVGADSFKNMKFCFVGTALKFHVGAMPRLEQLQFGVNAGHGSFEVYGVPFNQIRTKDVIADLDLGLDNLLSLEIVTANINCLGASTTEVEEVEAVVRGELEGHPNRPTIIVNRVHEKYMLSDEHREPQQHIEELVIPISVLGWNDESDATFISFLRSFQHLQKAVISMDCAGASLCEVDKVEADLRHAADVHPGHPTIQLNRINTEHLDDHDDPQDNSLSKLKLIDKKSG